MFFKVVNHLLEFDSDEVRAIPEFRELIRRDKGKRGNNQDVDARTKLRFFSELKYIYFYCHYKSPYSGYPDKERHTISVKDAELEPDWKPDAEVKAAIAKYMEFLDTPSIKILNSLQRGLTLSSNVIDNVCENMQFLLDEIKDSHTSLKGNDISDPVAYLQAKKEVILRQVEYTNGLIANLKILQDLGAKVPKTLENIDILAEKVKKEIEGDNLVRGGRQKGNRADPKQ